MAAPPAAYFISAHGGEGLAEFRVPAGCVIVIKATHGSYIVREHAAKLMRALYCEPTGLAIHPLANIPGLIDLLGSVLIFKEGDMCPDFRFMFLKKYLRKGGAVEFDPLSGLLPIPQTGPKRARLCAEMHRLKIVKTRMREEAKDVIPDMFRFSVSPTKEEVESMIDAYEEGYNGNAGDEDEDEDEDDTDTDSEEPATIRDLIDDPEDSPLTPLIRKTLSQILELQPDGSAGRPGVFYNFSCRGGLDVNLYEVVPYNNDNARVLPDFGSTVPAFGRNAKKTATKRTLAARDILLKGIGEAEFGRKRLIPGTRFTRAPVAAAAAAAAPVVATKTPRATRKKSRAALRKRERAATRRGSR